MLVQFHTMRINLSARRIADALRRLLGLRAARRSNGLRRLAGGWSEEEFAAFEEHVRETSEDVDGPTGETPV